MSGLFIDMAGLLAALSRGEFYLSIEQFSPTARYERLTPALKARKRHRNARKRDIDIDHSASEVAARASAGLSSNSRRWQLPHFAPSPGRSGTPREMIPACFLPRLVRNDERPWRLSQQVVGDPAEQHLAQPGTASRPSP